MKFLSLVLLAVSFNAFSMETKAVVKGSGWEAGFQAFKDGKHTEALAALEPMCNKDSHASSCHLVGIMYKVNKTDPDAAKKSVAAFTKACTTLKYKPACDDMNKK
jgi:hypothetical protein